MNKQKFFTLLYVALIIGIISFMIFMVFWLQGESKQCMKDPVKWFESKNDDAVCSCYNQNEVFSINNQRIPISTEIIIKDTDQ